MKLKILDRYIIRKFIGTYFFALLIIIVIVIIFDISEKIDHFVEKEAPLRAIIFDYYMNFIPYFINMFSPLFVFITVIFFTSKLAGNSEIVAMLSGGVSFGRLMYPYFISALFIAILSLSLNLFIIPHANKVRIEFEHKYVKSKFVGNQRNVHYQLSPGEFVYVESFSTWNNTAFKLTLESIRDNRIVSKLSAETAVWDTAKKAWTLNRYFIRNFNEDGTETITSGDKKDTVINLTLDDFYVKKNQVEALTYRELENAIDTQRMRGDKMIQYSLIEKNKRFAVPFSAFILTLMGVSLSSKKRRGGIGLNLGVGIALSFSYILFLKFSEMFVHTDTLPPEIALWLPNFIFAIIAIFLYRIAPK